MEKNISNIKSNHGGKRENAGRKKKAHGKYYGFNSSPDVDIILQSLKSSKTDFINDAILFYAKHKGSL